MKTGDIYGGNYLTAEDIKGRNINVTIESVSVMTDTKTEKKKLVLTFRGKDKTMPLNITNANAVEEILGTDETDDWEGKRICLYTTKVDFQGKRVLAIRIKECESNGGAKVTAPPPPAEPVTELSDEDIPF